MYIFFLFKIFSYKKLVNNFLFKSHILIKNILYVCIPFDAFHKIIYPYLL